MGDFSFGITMDQSIPKLSDASIPLEQIAKKIVDDSQRNIRKQTTPPGMGGKFRQLTKGTIAKKRRLGYSRPEEALSAKGIMYRAITWRKVGKNRYVVTVLGRGSPRRDLVALIHQEIGVPSKRGRVVRPFLGISTKTRRFALERMNRWTRKKIKEAPPKIIKIGLT